MIGFYKTKEASKLLGVHYRTLYNWEKKGNHRLFDVKSYIEKQKDKNEVLEYYDNIENKNERLNICYARVSSHGQKDDLERQKKNTSKRISRL